MADLNAAANAAIRRIAEAPKRRRARILKEELAKLPPNERDAVAGWISAFRMTLPPKPRNWERPAIFIVAVLFLAALLGIHLAIPNTTPSQDRTFNTILALMGAAFGGMLPGAISVNVKGFRGLAIRAVGAAAFFVIIYLWRPA